MRQRVSVPHQWPQVPNVDVVSGSCVLVEIGNELVKIVEHDVVGSAPAAKKTVPYQHWSALLQNPLNGRKIFGSSDLLAIERPLIGFDTVTRLKF